MYLHHQPLNITKIVFKLTHRRTLSYAILKCRTQGTQEYPSLSLSVITGHALYGSTQIRANKGTRTGEFGGMIFLFKGVLRAKVDVHDSIKNPAYILFFFCFLF